MQYPIQLCVYVFPNLDYNLDYPIHQNEVADSCAFHGNFFQTHFAYRHLFSCCYIIVMF